MLQQLFLFDKGEEQKEIVQQTAEGNVMDKDESREELLSSEENTNQQSTTMPINADPFASVQEKKEEKIEQMLLMPNTRRGRKSFKDMDEEAILVAVPDDEILFQKQYYSMRTVAEWF